VQLLDVVRGAAAPWPIIARRVDDKIATSSPQCSGTGAGCRPRSPSPATVARVEATLGERGRVLIRPSGTEHWCE
jgi:phosphomannomutase